MPSTLRGCGRIGFWSHQAWRNTTRARSGVSMGNLWQFLPAFRSFAERFLRCGTQSVQCRVWDAAIGPRNGWRRPVARQGPPIAQGALGWRGSISQHLFVVRGRVNIVARFVAVWTREALWWRSGRRVVPSARWRKIFSTTRESSMTAMTRTGFWQTGQRSGSTCQTRRIKFRTGGWACGAGRFATSGRSRPGSGRRPG